MAQEIIRANSNVLTLTLLEDLAKIADLGTATEVVFRMIAARAAAAVLTITGTPANAAFTFDSPTAGQMKVALATADTDHPPGMYDVSVQLKFANADIEEFLLPHAVRIKEQRITST